MKNISMMVSSLLVSLAMVTAAMGAETRAKDPHRLREPEQFGAAAIPGSGKRDTSKPKGSTSR